MLKNKIKILILSHTSELLGGAERSMLDVFDYLSEKYDITSEFILREPLNELAAALDERDWKYVALPYTFWSDSKPPDSPEKIIRNAAENAQAVGVIRKIIRNTKPDVVITNTIVCPWAAIAANYERVPHVWFAREFGDLDHGRVFEIGREQTWQDIDQLSDLVVTISEHIAEHISKYVTPDKVRILYNPFKINEIEVAAKANVMSPFKSDESLKVAIAGNIAPSKGQLEAIKAIALLTEQGHDVELCIIGRDGELEFMQEMQSVMRRHNIQDKVYMMGFKSNALAYVKHADVCVMASRREAFGRVTFEYLVCGKPVVGSRDGATPEMVLDGHNGYLYDTKDPASLAAALQHYIDNPSLIQEHGGNGKKHALQMMEGAYSIDAIYNELKKVSSIPTKTLKPLNFSYRWLEYVDIAYNQAQIFSVKRMMRVRLRQKARGAYHRTKRIKHAVSKKKNDSSKS